MPGPWLISATRRDHLLISINSFPTTAPTNTPIPSITPTPTQVVASEYRTTIDYTYDPLYRLTSANYTGAYTSTFAYSYDSVGNRLAQMIDGATTNYVYDNANRLTSVNGQAYSWDNNGNLLNDGVNTYAYDQANRLIGVGGQGTGSSYAYNGVGDRLQQTIDGVTTNYALDLNAGLTQVLADGTNNYLYGVSRIGQYDNAMQYFGADGLGSVRQIYNAAGVVRRNTLYDPFGNVLTTNGTIASAYGFTGEQTDATGLVYLRARYYAPGQGRFVTRDTWEGDYQRPLSLNKWNYVEGDPANRIDPTGYDPGKHCDSSDFPLCLGVFTAQQAVDFARTIYAKSGPITIYGRSLGGRLDCNNPAWSLPQRTIELAADFVCERGPRHVYFDGASGLTQELAHSAVFDSVRREFYAKGDISESQEKKFNKEEFGLATLDFFSSAWRDDVPITHFLGSFDFLARKEAGRIKFQVDNQTDRASGTHIPERYPPDDQRHNPLSIERVIEERPGLAYMNALKLIEEYRDESGNPIVSILRPLSRDETRGFGGGAMQQTFTWTEADVSCPLSRLNWPIYLPLLDIH